MAMSHVLKQALVRSVAVVGIVGSVAGFSSAAAAEPQPQDNPPLPLVSSVDLTIDEGAAKGQRRVLLVCEPAGGTHPQAKEACESLASVQGDFQKLRSDNHQSVCNLIYSPVSVSARGLWKNRWVDYKETFPNTCVMNKRTGSVFTF